MATVGDVLDALERIAPARYAFPWDSVGLQVGDPSARVERAVLALDRSLAAVDCAVQADAQLLVTHHPLFFDKLGRLDYRTHVGRTIQALIGGGVSLVTAHTNWDSAPGGINDALSAKLGLEVTGSFGSDSRAPTLKGVVFVPIESLDRVLDAASASGAGIIGNYDRCGFWTEGLGTFRPGLGANPAATGTRGESGAEVVREARLEFLLPADRRGQVERAIRSVHPYEEPAIDFLPLEFSSGHPAGRLSKLEEAVSLREVVDLVGDKLGPCWAWGDPARKIRTVAMVGGAADGEWIAAQRAGADVLLTGEVKQHVALEASESGMAIIAAGHYATEMPGMFALADRLRTSVRGVEWDVFEPGTGFAGKPA